MILKQFQNLSLILNKSISSTQIFCRTLMSITKITSSKCFGGYQYIYSHHSKTLQCDMKFGIYLPPDADEHNKVPVLYFLNGIASTEENFIKKGGAQRFAAEHRLCIVSPDTSPRNVKIPGDDASDDFGTGASFYVDATESPWDKNYQMYSYITCELINLINDNFPILKNKQSISGLSMGGHGALICALKNPGFYCSVSAFAPISNPIQTTLGQKAFKGYLGSDTDKWKEYDATELVGRYDGVPIELFIDQGTSDEFYDRKHLLPENLIAAAAKNDSVHAFLKMRDGYNHSHFYVATMIEEHIKYHVKFLKS